MRHYAAAVLAAAAVLPVLLAGACTTPGDASAAGLRFRGAGQWGAASGVPGIAALGTDSGAGIGSVSCASPGNCSAVGTYGIGLGHAGVFAASQVRGTWHAARAIPGLTALNKARYASIGSVSCASAGNCSAGGSYQDGSRRGQAFVVSEVRGRWRDALEVPGTAVLNVEGAGVSSVSCAAPGDCTAGGSYLRRFRHGQPFVVSEVRGKWRMAIEVPGIAALNTNGTAGIGSVSCTAPGDCSASGTYRDSADNTHAFVLSQVHGTWGLAIAVPGAAALGGPGGGAGMSALSCGSPGNCAAVGYFYDSQGFEYPFVVNQVGGHWGTAMRVQGMAAFGQKSAGQFYAVSCASAGNCVAAGSEGVNNGFDVGGGGQPFVVTETKGTWGSARLVPGITKLNTGADGAVVTISCPSAGDCTAGGYYGIGKPGNKIYDLQAFVATEVDGAWGRASQVPGLRVLNRGDSAGIAAVSCAVPGRCSAGGSYESSSHYGVPFVVAEGRKAG